MAQHVGADWPGKRSFFHSSYLAGGPTLWAGELSVFDGRLSAINTVSGHYLPETVQMLNALDALVMCGVSLNDVIAKVYYPRIKDWVYFRAQSFYHRRGCMRYCDRLRDVRDG